MDLESTIGETAALGASGVILWGASSDYKTEVGSSEDQSCSPSNDRSDPGRESWQRQAP